MSAPLLPIAPILLLPFILVAIVVGLPIWIVALLVLGVLRLLVWPLERLMLAIGSGTTMRESERLAAAFGWVASVGGLTRRFSGAQVGSASMMTGGQASRDELPPRA